MPNILLQFNEDGSVTWKPAGASGNRQQTNWIEAPECPQHGPWRLVPGGTSKGTGKAYGAFWACEKGCPNRPGRDWVAHNPPEDSQEYDDDPFAQYG